MSRKNNEIHIPLHQVYTRTQLRPCDQAPKGDKGRELTEIVMAKIKSEKNEIPVTLANGSTVPLVELCPEQGSYNPFEHRNVSHPTSDWDTLVHLLKGSLGSGILAMPLAFKNAGLFFGLVSTFIIGLICTYCIHVLVICSHKLCKRMQIPSLDFANVAETAFLAGPDGVRKYSRLARFLVNAFLVLDLFGCCCVYIVFVAANIQEVVELYTDVSYDIRLYMLVLLPILVPCNLIRNLKFLSPLSLLANIFLLVGIGITLSYILVDIPPVNSVQLVASVEHWPMFFGTVIFALEGIGVVLPLENNMKNPDHFIGCPGVVNIGMFIVVLLYALVGFFGYLKFGEGVLGSVTLNLPNDILAQSVKIMIALAIFFTYNLQFHVPIDIIWKNIQHKVSESNHIWVEYGLRVFFVILTVIISIAIPNLGPFISLVGAICLSNLGLTLPAIIEMVTYWENPGMGRYNWRLWKNIFILLFGVVGCATGTYVSFHEIIDMYTKAE